MLLTFDRSRPRAADERKDSAFIELMRELESLGWPTLTECVADIARRMIEKVRAGQ